MCRCGRRGQEKFGTRAEIKNLNSFRFVEKAIQYEVARQIELIESGGKVVQETRLYDSDKDETRSMRSKEEANDYRYFPDPDLLPVEIEEAFIEAVRATLPELPDEKAARFAQAISACRPTMPACSARQPRARRVFRSRGRGLGREPRQARRELGDGRIVERAEPRQCRHRRIAGHARGACRPACMRIVDETISGKIAKEVFEAMWSEGKPADAIIEAKGLKQITDSGAIEGVIDAVIAANPKQLADYRSGKDKLFGFFVGQVMKATGGKANPAQLNELLKTKLGGGAKCMIATACIASCSSNSRFAATWCISMPRGARLIEHREYPHAIRDTLGEAVAASLLLAATIKFEGVLSLQLQGDGPVHLLLAQCTSGLGVRGSGALPGRGCRRSVARDIGDLIGDGQSDRDLGDRRRRAALPRHRAHRGRALGRVAAGLLRKFRAIADAAVAACGCARRLGHAAAEAARRESARCRQADAAAVEDAWRRVQLIAETLTPRNCARWPMRKSCTGCSTRTMCGLFEPSPVYFRCRCSRERVAGMLQGLARRKPARCSPSAAKSKCAAISATAPMCSMRWTSRRCSRPPAAADSGSSAFTDRHAATALAAPCLRAIASADCRWRGRGSGCRAATPAADAQPFYANSFERSPRPRH